MQLTNKLIHCLKHSQGYNGYEGRPRRQGVLTLSVDGIRVREALYSMEFTHEYGNRLWTIHQVDYVGLKPKKPRNCLYRVIFRVVTLEDI